MNKHRQLSGKGIQGVDRSFHVVYYLAKLFFVKVIFQQVGYAYDIGYRQADFVRGHKHHFLQAFDVCCFFFFGYFKLGDVVTG